MIQDICKESKTQIRFSTGTTEIFNVTVGVHQGSALNPLLFSIVRDSLTEGVRRETSRTMMFADDVVLFSKTKKEVKRRLDEWRSRLESRGMRINRQKMEYLCARGEQWRSGV